MISVAEARRFVLPACGILAPKRMAVSDASGHVLAETVRADADVPPFANWPWTVMQFGRPTRSLLRRSFE